MEQKPRILLLDIADYNITHVRDLFGEVFEVLPVNVIRDVREAGYAWTWWGWRKKFRSALQNRPDLTVGPRDVVLTDLVFIKSPREGLNAIRSLKSLWSSLPVVVWTCQSQQWESHALDAGAEWVFRKGMQDIQLMRDALAELVEPQTIAAP